MKHLYSLLLLICLYPAAIFAQVDSTNTQTDSLRKDTLRPKPRMKRITDSTRVIERKNLHIDSLQLKDSIRLKDSLRLVEQTADSLRKKLKEQLPAQNLKDGEKKIFT